jgi:hypothetical protein
MGLGQERNAGILRCAQNDKQQYPNPITQVQTLEIKQYRPPVGERRWCPHARDLCDPGHRVLVVVKV